MTDVGIGIIGYGDFAQFLRHAWEGLPGVHVAAIADVNPDRNPKDTAFYTMWQELIRDDCVDLVVIGTPPSTHSSIALAAIEAGCHVLIEKPPAMTSAQVAALVEAGERRGRIVAVDYMLRYHPLVEALRELDRAHLLGKLQHFSMSNYAYDGKLGPSHWFWDKSVSGGILLEHAVHFFDMLAYVHPSRPVRLSAHGVSRKPGMEDKVAAVIEHEDGLIATQYHHFFRPTWFERQTFRFGYDLADIDMEGWIPSSLRLRAVVDQERKDKILGLFPGAEVQEHPIEVNKVRCGGVDYAVDREFELEIVLPQPKIQVYTECLKATMADIAACVEKPGRPLRVALENCQDSVRVASAAADFVVSGQPMEIP